MYSFSLLPNSYKTLGLIVTIVGMGVPIFILLLPSSNKSDINGFLPFSNSIVLAGLLTLALAKDKIEDELVMNLRFKALAGAFIIGSTFAIIYPCIDVLFGNTIVDGNIGSVFLTMSIWYHVNFYILKKSR